VEAAFDSKRGADDRIRDPTRAPTETTPALLAPFCSSPPRTALSAEQVQQFLLHLLRERKLARYCVNRYVCAFRFFYGTVLGHDGDALRNRPVPAPFSPVSMPPLPGGLPLERSGAKVRILPFRQKIDPGNTGRRRSGSPCPSQRFEAGPCLSTR